MSPWFIATQTFNSQSGETWARYIAWSRLTQLSEVVSLDPMLCPPVLADIEDEYWPQIVNEDYLLHFFVDLEYLLRQLPGSKDCNLLCVHRNPTSPPSLREQALRFEFLGYDLVDMEGGASALTNCGGFPDVFDGSELSQHGLLTSLDRALEVQSELRKKHTNEPHANCNVWAISRAVGRDCQT
jgi:hypothetical protein